MSKHRFLPVAAFFVLGCVTTYDAGGSTIKFRGGFLDGQVGKNVRTTGFSLSSTVSCEPWR